MPLRNATEIDDPSRTIGLRSATGVGVGAIVGGGIFVLAGTAFENAGPAAILAFALNGIIAFLTAMTFAEISSAFPESGGAYTFAKKVLSVQAAFATGWILWFAYIVAGVLYALGFAAFALVSLAEVLQAIGVDPPLWLSGRMALLFLAMLATLAYTAKLALSRGEGDDWATVGKVIVFALLIIAGLIAFLRQDMTQSWSNLTPFFDNGVGGLAAAMGFTFIALQGFDLIAAIAGEVKDPGRVIPKAMFLALACAAVIYLPLLLLVSTVGVDEGQSVAALAANNPETVIAIAAERFMGKIGYLLVLVAALLSTLSALQANLLAASRVAHSMGQDHTLPAVLGESHPERKTPIVATATSALTLCAILLMVPNLAAAGAAASLIFLLSFALAHVTTYLARVRGGTKDAPYRTPLFPLVPIIGGLACVCMAAFQAAVVPDAAVILFLWLGLGGLLYWSLFSKFAGITDAANAALDPRLVRLRGHSPLVLVPIANPAKTPALISVANLIAPSGAGRVLLLSIVPEKAGEGENPIPPQLRDTQQIVYDALAQSYESGNNPEALITAAPKPMQEIARIAEEHHCACLLLGLGDLPDSALADLEELLNGVDCDVALMRSPDGFHIEDAKRILVPVGGGGSQHQFRASLLASLCRTGSKTVRLVSTLPLNASKEDEDQRRIHLRGLSELRIPASIEITLLRTDDPIDAIRAEAQECDLMVLGMPSSSFRRKAFGDFSVELTKTSNCATLILSRRKARAFELFDPLRDEVIGSLREVVRTAANARPRGRSSRAPDVSDQ